MSCFTRGHCDTEPWVSVMPIPPYLNQLVSVKSMTWQNTSPMRINLNNQLVAMVLWLNDRLRAGRHGFDFLVQSDQTTYKVGIHSFSA